MPQNTAYQIFPMIFCSVLSDLVVKFELGGLVICKKNSSGHNIIAEKLWYMW